MRVGEATGWLMIGASLATLCCLGIAQQPVDRGTVSLNSIVDALERAQAAVRPEVSYQVVREYRLFGTSDSGADSEVVAEVNFTPPAREDYKIQRSSGSNRGQQVVQQVLKHETEGASSNSQARTALTRDNYDFSYIGEAVFNGTPCYLLELKPRRREADLISGQVWIDEHSFLMRHIEGELAKEPFVVAKKSSGQAYLCQTGWNMVADRHGSRGGCAYCGTHTLTSRIVDYRAAGEVATAATFTRPTGKAK